VQERVRERSNKFIRGLDGILPLIPTFSQGEKALSRQIEIKILSRVQYEYSPF